MAMTLITTNTASGAANSAFTSSIDSTYKLYIFKCIDINPATNSKNIAVNFSIITKVGVNKNEVLLKCVSTVQDFFDIDRWQIGQPIVLSDIAYALSLVEGVASLARPPDGEESIVITNKDDAGLGYSGNTYNVTADDGGLINGILYPALDPSIFEVKYPNSDIQGRVLGDNLQITE